jgi:hypothetical protein
MQSCATSDDAGHTWSLLGVETCAAFDRGDVDVDAESAEDMDILILWCWYVGWACYRQLVLFFVFVCLPRLG